MQTESREQFRYIVVEKRIQDMIEAGVLHPGDKVPSLRKVCASMRLSLGTVSQAYAELERKGFIESRPKSGFFVRRQEKLLAGAPAKSEPLAAPTLVTRASLIRDVLDYVGERHIVPLGLAVTSDALLPTKTLTRCLTEAVRAEPARAIGYNSVAGDAELRRQIAYRSAESGAPLKPEEIIVTVGAMEALYIALRCVTRPGDNVVIASPAYFAFLQLLENLGLRAIEIPSCPECGISPADLDNVLRKFEVKACIFSPNFNNPDGGLTPEDAKRELTDMLAERGIPLIEDDIYGELYFGDRRPLSCNAYDRKDTVLVCSSFSKTLSAGYRVGWIAPGAFYHKAFEVKATTSICTAGPSQMAVAEYLRQGHFDRHLRRLRPGLEKQMHAMRQLVARYFPEGTKATKPKGGTVLWLELPGGLDSIEFFRGAQALGIGVAPGAIFSTQDKYNSCLRLSYGIAWTPAVEDGVRRLGELAWSLRTSGGTNSTG